VAQQPNLGLGRLIVELSRSHKIRHTHTPGRTLWKSDQSVAEAATYTTNATDEHPRRQWIRTRDPSKRVASEPSLRAHGHGIGTLYCAVIILIMCGSHLSLYEFEPRSITIITWLIYLLTQQELILSKLYCNHETAYVLQLSCNYTSTFPLLKVLLCTAVSRNGLNCWQARKTALDIDRFSGISTARVVWPQEETHKVIRKNKKTDKLHEKCNQVNREIQFHYEVLLM
jgi:hypothetical protein